jgi:hypothetical protein
MMESNGTLIKMEGVKKVFYTDEVETHALSEIHLLPDRQAVASPRSFLFWGYWIRLPKAIIGSTASRFRS